MFRFVTKNLNLLGLANRNHSAYIIQVPITNPLRLLRTLANVESKNTSNTCNPTNQDHPTVSYLVNKFGLPLHSAISASKKVTITSTPKADSVLELFKSYGFTQSQLINLITKCPSVLVADPDSTLKPRLEFFQSLGLSDPDVPIVLFSHKLFLQTSLPDRIVPTVDFLKSIVQTNPNIHLILRRWFYIIYHNFRTDLEPNVLTLRAHGMPQSNISKLLVWKPRVFTIRSDIFRDRVRSVVEMGLDPKSLAFIRSVAVILFNGDSLWERKASVLRSFGWSDNDILAAFKSQPLSMGCSEKKMRIMMDFCLNKLGLKLSNVVKRPKILMFSLEKRIIPRCSVLQLLLSRGLIKSSFNIVPALDMSKMAFDKKFVTKYLEVIPEIVSVYQGEKGFPVFEATQFAAMFGFKNTQKLDMQCDQ